MHCNVIWVTPVWLQYNLHMSTIYKEINAFWFGPLTPGKTADSAYTSRWFKKDPDFDNTIRSRFGDRVEQAAQGEFKHWESLPEGRLALVVLLDQFPRNLYRNSPKAWQYDPLALQHTLNAIQTQQDVVLHAVERSILYMPLMHSEDMDIQEQSLQQFSQLVKDTEGALSEALSYNLKYARQHADIIQRFGRYPHRNELLGRTSTEAEKRFLEQPGSSF